MNYGRRKVKAKRIALVSIAATLLLIVGGISMESYEKATMVIGPGPNVRMERGVVTALEETSESAWRMELTVEEANDGEQVRVFLVSEDSLAVPFDFAVGDVIDVSYFINYDVQDEGRLRLTTARIADA